MYVVFDLNDERSNKRTEYLMKDVTFIPRIGETIELSNGIRERALNGSFKVNKVEYQTRQTKLEEDQNTGKGFVETVRIYANKINT